MAIFVMLNNYMHDLMTALFAVSALAAWFMLRSEAMQQAPRALRPVADRLVRVGMFALIWTLIGGMIRGWAYEKYEWMEAVGKAQVPALILKHVILVSLVIAGLVVLYRIRKLSSSMASDGAGV